MSDLYSLEVCSWNLQTYLSMSQKIWDYMHDTMQYDDDLINAMSILSDFLIKRYNEELKIVNQIPKV